MSLEMTREESLDAYLESNPYQCLLLVLNHLADIIAFEKRLEDIRNYHLAFDSDYMPVTNNQLKESLK